MRMTTRELIGEVLTRVRVPSMVAPMSVFYGLNHAQEELLAIMREADFDTYETEVYLDLQSGRDVYELPEGVHEITKMERLDHGNRAWPVVRMTKDRDDIDSGGRLGGTIYTGVPFSFDQPFTYVPQSGRRFRLQETPTIDKEDGLRLYARPFLVRLANLEDVPYGIPEQIQECLVPRAVVRVHSQGHKLADGGAFKDYRGTVEMQLGRYLYPADGERSRDIDEVYGWYEEVF